MTCIVGLVGAGRVYVGADSLACADSLDCTVRRDAKVFRNGEAVLGFTDSYRMGQLLHHSFKLPPPPKRAADLERYMVVDFVDAVRDTLKSGGWARKDSERESGGNFLVGLRGRLFEVESEFQVGEPERRYAAVGCGESFALGSLHATARLAPEARVRAALAAAETHSAGVRRPFRVLATAGKLGKRRTR